MDFGNIKQVFIKQGEVKRILEGDVVLWEKTSDGRVIRIPSDIDTITDFAVGRYTEIIFKTDESEPTWSISELPAGLTYEVTSGGLKIAGYPTEAGSKDVEISVGSYTQTVAFEIEDDGKVQYGIRIITSNVEPITDFALNKFASKTFEAAFNVPEEEQDSPVEWIFMHLPDGLSASGAIVSGTATSKGTVTSNVVVKKGSYSTQKGYQVKRYGLEVYGTAMVATSLPNGQQGTSYSTTLHVSKLLPPDVGSLRYYASGLPSGLSLNSSTGVISGTPTSAGTYSVHIYAVQSPYTSPTRTLSLSIASPPPGITTPDATVYLNASMCRDNYFLNSSVGKLKIYGNGFTQSGMKFWGGGSFIVNGDSSASVPVVNISINVVNDTTLELDFVLTKRSQADANSLRKRSLTTRDIFMYTGGGNSGPAGVGAVVFGRLTIGIGFA